ncbi:medium-chain fatty acid-CoA ligase faa2 [Coemansia sp. RSA 1722]|nr:medium-chain fatty acid-CoA ligase faa2 [Coemansia sp. RSA 486]KAJ2235755.1 medium-chain fatty acid-CoA ligase faa2 [Coemansia sp. RSA 485]KAJ2605081.1 medium-chain fatty acid-CoA ligase faa2 [Coemansia sp. RSA 1722]KAJ2639309.1 medium-chain fatty acid-CoA ligase faa2 [Coemansia sp. RSA 1286]
MMKSYLVPGSAEPGYSAIMRNRECKDNMFPDPASNVTTLYELFQHRINSHPDGQFAGSRKFDAVTKKFGSYEWISSTKAAELVDQFGSGLDLVYQKHAIDAPSTAQGTNKQHALGLYSINRVEWLLAEFAGFRSNKFSVALYDTLGAESVEFIVEHAGIAVLVCSIDKVPRLLQLKDKLPTLRAIISMDSFAEHGKNPAALPFTVNSIRVLQEWAGSKDVALLDIDQVMQMGINNPTKPRLPKPSDLCTICYTSGTTGQPKGAMATHESYVFSSKSGSLAVPMSNPVYLSFLPLAHCYERNNIYVGLFSGGCVGFYSGNVLTIAEDAQALRPTTMSGVPRLYNRIYDRIAAATIYAPGLSGVIARTAIRQKLERLDSGLGFTHPFWDRVVCNKIRQFFGGNLKLMVSGSAPIDAKVLNFMRVALAVTFLEGYASTECNAAATVCLMDENKAGHVGVPYPAIEVRLRDVPEMNYLATDQPCPRGEVLIRGKSVFIGYYNDQEKTKAAFDGDWLITGDIGQFNPDGNLKIIDRRKNILKLAQGEYVAVEFLETVYSRCPLIQNVFVHGDSLQSSLVGVVVPDPDTFLPWARKISGNNTESLENLCRDPQITGALLVELRLLGRESKLQGFEILREIYCDPIPFDVETNCLLTSTFKLKRDVAKQYYADEIKAMYDKINQSRK